MMQEGLAEELIKAMSDSSVDAIITDPPYGTNDGRGKRCMRGGDSVPFAIEWDTTLPLDWLADAFRVCRPGAALLMFTDNLQVGSVWEALESVGFKCRQLFFWDKPDCPPTPRPNFASAIESGVYAIKPGATPTWTGGGWCRNVLTFNLAHKYIDGVSRLHPTQKPLPLMKRLVELVTQPGDMVLDPFAGSGTTGVAALQLGRRFQGFEKDPDFVRVAEERLSLAQDPEGDLQVVQQRRPKTSDPNLIEELFGGAE